MNTFTLNRHADLDHRPLVIAVIALAATMTLAAGGYALLPAAALFWVASSTRAGSETALALSVVPLALGAALAAIVTATAAGLCAAHTPALFAIMFFGAAAVMLGRHIRHR